ncbi:hypothetical protein DAPPUDRAFT_109689 [Daphnia pulex]|uniref:Uncharacterized protein n=1 Tax=Daphnia pulex TaxID=6669 RepID=E9H3V9_DAPPU|nr:hypothetical protein DAPPUDRAFT_109689 [Daphnia pulex]|eukprot:EFX73594.1 hypothetical protein DAPPUDRAFT_109689 [Daphnia pulex]
MAEARERVGRNEQDGHDGPFVNEQLTVSRTRWAWRRWVQWTRSRKLTSLSLASCPDDIVYCSAVLYTARCMNPTAEHKLRKCVSTLGVPVPPEICELFDHPPNNLAIAYIYNCAIPANRRERDDEFDKLFAEMFPSSATTQAPLEMELLLSQMETEFQNTGFIGDLDKFNNYGQGPRRLHPGCAVSVAPEICELFLVIAYISLVCFFCRLLADAFGDLPIYLGISQYKTSPTDLQSTSVLEQSSKNQQQHESPYPANRRERDDETDKLFAESSATTQTPLAIGLLLGQYELTHQNTGWNNYNNYGQGGFYGSGSA